MQGTISKGPVPIILLPDKVKLLMGPIGSPCQKRTAVEMFTSLSCTLYIFYPNLKDYRTDVQAESIVQMLKLIISIDPKHFLLDFLEL